MLLLSNHGALHDPRVSGLNLAIWFSTLSSLLDVPSISLMQLSLLWLLLGRINSLEDCLSFNRAQSGIFKFHSLYFQMLLMLQNFDTDLAFVAGFDGFWRWSKPSKQQMLAPHTILISDCRFIRALPIRNSHEEVAPRLANWFLVQLVELDICHL